MWVFLATLTVLFLGAIAGYLVVRLWPDGPPPGCRACRGLWLATAALVLGSVTIRPGLSRDPSRSAPPTRWLATTLHWAFVFLFVQSWNWWGCPPAPNCRVELYAFTFFMLTGLTRRASSAGVVLLAHRARAFLRRYGSGRYGGITYAAMYWHFLDAIWVLLFRVLWSRMAGRSVPAGHFTGRTDASPLFPLAGDHSSEFDARFHPRAANVRRAKGPAEAGSITPASSSTACTNRRG
jgi:heme/copper-type cytochrome/quinol oxidase subunit 3